MYAARTNRVRHDAVNLALGLINATVTALLFAGAVLYITEASRTHQFGLLHHTDWPPPVTLLTALLAFDAWQYLWHRANHKIPLLWRFHAVHHTDTDLDATTAVRFHTGEIILSSTARLAVLPLIGITMPQLALYECILLPVILFHHSNIRLSPRADRLLSWLIVTPHIHWVHHSQIKSETDSNYATLLSCWDRIFKTFTHCEDPAQINFGLKDFKEQEWRSLPKTLAIPFTHDFKSGSDKN
jgi:sterol desaturase/sphingolipid hydroxylase (fatty acid hydroxylase superfamily)